MLRIISRTISNYKRGPGPIPLENLKDQKEFEQLVKKNEESTETKHKDYVNIKVKGKIDIGEINGPKGLEPTRFGDWEKNGRVYDF